MPDSLLSVNVSGTRTNVNVMLALMVSVLLDERVGGGSKIQGCIS